MKKEQQDLHVDFVNDGCSMAKKMFMRGNIA